MTPVTPDKLMADVKKCRNWMEYVKREDEDTKRRFAARELTQEAYERERHENITCMRILSNAARSLSIEANMLVSDLGSEH